VSSQIVATIYIKKFKVATENREFAAQANNKSFASKTLDEMAKRVFANNAAPYITVTQPCQETLKL